jgi:hypothetical protein
MRRLLAIRDSRFANNRFDMPDLHAPLGARNTERVPPRLPENATKKMEAANIVDLIRQATTLGLAVHAAQPKGTAAGTAKGTANGASKRDKPSSAVNNGTEYDCAFE